MTLSNEKLLEYSGEHVYYEVEMFLWLIEIFQGLASPRNAQENVVKNALIESFAIHVRNLIAFFYHGRVEADDVMAEHFVDDPERWRRLLPPLSENLKRARERAHKEVAHLTTARIAGAPPEKAWPALELKEEMLIILRLFVENASPARLHQRVINIVRNA